MGHSDDPDPKKPHEHADGEFACTQQFKCDRSRAALRSARDVSGKTAMGTAGHETIARVLQHEGTRDAVLGGYSSVTHDQIRRVLLEEFDREISGKQVVWYGKAEHDDTLADVTAMLFGLFHDMHRHVAAVLLVEAGFIAQLGEYWTEGHIDSLYRRASSPTRSRDGLEDGCQSTPASPRPLLEAGSTATPIRIFLCVLTSLLARWRVRRARPHPDDRPAPLAPWDLLALAAARHARSRHRAARVRVVTSKVAVADGVIAFDGFPSIIL